MATFNPKDFKTDFSHFSKAGGILAQMFKEIPGALEKDETYQTKKAQLGEANAANKQLYAELSEFATEFQIDIGIIPNPGTDQPTDEYATVAFATVLSAAKNKGVDQGQVLEFLQQKVAGGGAMPQVGQEQQALAEQQKLQQSVDFRTGQPTGGAQPPQGQAPPQQQQQTPDIMGGPSTILDSIGGQAPQQPPGPEGAAPGVGAIGQGGIPTQAFPGVEQPENILSRLAIEKQPPPPPRPDMTPAERRNFEREALDNDYRLGLISTEKHSEGISVLNKQEATELKDENTVQREKQKGEQIRQDDYRDNIETAIAEGTGVMDKVTGKFINDEGIDTKIKKLTERYVITGKEFSRRDEIFKQRGGAGGGPGAKEEADVTKQITNLRTAQTRLEGIKATLRTKMATNDYTANETPESVQGQIDEIDARINSNEVNLNELVIRKNLTPSPKKEPDREKLLSTLHKKFKGNATLIDRFLREHGQEESGLRR